MPNCKSIIFMENMNNPGTEYITTLARYWYDLNKETISDLHGTFGLIRDESSPTKYRKALILHYQGEGGVNPVDCEHLNREDVIITPSTCFNTGITNILCVDCNMLLDIITTPKLEHEYIFVSNNDETCLNDGTLTGTCKHCGATFNKINYGSALGHNHRWSVHTDATCLNDKVNIGVCSRCNDTIYETIENTALGHNYVYTSNNDATCTDDGTETGKCSRCSDTVVRVVNGTALGHEYPSTWTVRTAATETKEGLEFKKCIRCDNEITRSIPKLTHTWRSNNNGTHTCVTIGGCGKTETCSPNNPGSVCTKCGYQTPALDLITIIFNPEGGSISETSRQIVKGSNIGTLPTAIRDGYEFGGWFTASEGGLKVDENYSVASSITLYARWGRINEDNDMLFGDATSTFNIQYKGDRTNYNDNPYTFYSRYSNGNTSNIVIQTAISSNENNNNMTNSNPTVKLFMKVTNKGETGNFDIGFDCDSYVEGDDCLNITRISNGVKLGEYFTVTVPYDNNIWVGKYSERESNRYKNSSIGTVVGRPGDEAGSENDSGYAFTINNININKNSYTILEVTFQKL